MAMTKEIKEVESVMARSNILDKMFSAAAGAFFLFTGYVFIYGYVQAQGTMRYVLAGVGAGFVLYVLLAPAFRK